MEKWRSALTLRKKNKTVDEEKSSASNRYQSDLEQARAMRSCKLSNTTDQSVLLGMQGLDEADKLSQIDRDEALKLYELSLEVLIRFLKNPELTTSPLDRETIQARVMDALSSAETLKAMKPYQGKTDPASKSQHSKYENLSRALTSVINTPQQRKNSSNVVTPKVNCKSSRKVSTTPPQAAVQKTADSSVSNLHQTVIEELFVNPEDLQKTTWNDIAGLESIKQSLQEAAVLPLMRPDLFTGLRKPQNVLLWGPPGTGKTMLVRAVARESHCNLFVCSASSLTSKWMGEAEKLVKALFSLAVEMSPSIVFIDEVDSLLSSRKSDGEHEASRRLKTEFMVQMDGVKGDDEQRVLVLACTNCPWDIDSAVLRRFPRRLFVPLPDKDARKGLIVNLLKKAGKHSLTKRELYSVVKRTKGFSCSDIAAIASEASFGPLRSLGNIDAIRTAHAEDVRPINIHDFDDALEQATKSVTLSQLKRYTDWKEEQGAL